MTRCSQIVEKEDFDQRAYALVRSSLASTADAISAERSDPLLGRLRNLVEVIPFPCIDGRVGEVVREPHLNGRQLDCSECPTHETESAGLGRSNHVRVIRHSATVSIRRLGSEPSPTGLDVS